MTSTAVIDSKSSDSSTKVLELESIRGLAALLIVFVHFPKWHPSLDSWFIVNSNLMVELFFVLSGFVIYGAYGDRLHSTRDVLKFQFLRFGRLYPVHLVFLTMFVLAEGARLAASSVFGVALSSPAFSANGLIALLQQLLLVQAIGPTGNALTFNGPAWSISVEFYTYVIFSLIVLFTREKKNLIIAAAFVLSFLLLVGTSRGGFDHLLRCLTGFFLGCMVNMATQRSRIVLPPVVALIVAVAMLAFLGFKPPEVFDWVIYFLTAALVFTLLQSEGGVLRRILKFPPLIWLGTISYSVYMSHPIIALAYDAALRRIGHANTIIVKGVPTAELTAGQTIIAGILLIALVLAVSALIYRYVEAPFRLKSRHVAAKLFGQTA